MKKKILLISICTLLLAGCGKVSKLSNGDDAVVSFSKGDKISVNSLYEKMKKDYALENLITMIDTQILETEFKDYKAEASNYAENYIKSMEESYGGEEEFLKALQQYGYSTIEAYQNYLYLGYLQNHAVEEYAKTLVSDKDIEKYYNEKAQGDVEISHILITADVKDDATDEDKTKAEEAAKKKAEDLIKELKESKDVAKTFKKLVKENSKDDATKDKDGSLGKVTYGDLSESYDELLDAAYTIKDGEIYDKVITTELGYHVIMKTKSYEKESLKKLKKDIIEILSKDLVQNTADISIKGLEYYRDKYGMKIEDNDLKKQYESYITRALANLNSNNKESAEQ